MKLESPHKLWSVIALLVIIYSANAQSGVNALLLDAIKTNNQKEAEILLKNGANVNYQDENAASVLMWAVYKTDPKFVLHLVDLGADTNLKGAIYLDSKKDAYYGNLLSIAAGEADMKMLKCLVEDLGIPVDDKELNPKTGVEDGWTALQWASSRSNIEALDYLNSKGAKINTSLLEGILNKKNISEVLTLAEKLNQLFVQHKIMSDSVEIALLTSIGIAYEGLDVLDSAERYLLRANDLISVGHLTDSAMKKKIILFLAKTYQSASKYDKAERYYKERISFPFNFKDSVDAAYHFAAYSNLGQVYRKSGKLDMAEQTFISAQKLVGEVWGKNNALYTSFFSRLGQIKSDQGDLKMAVEYDLKVLENNSPSNYMYLITGKNLGKTYRDMKMYEKADSIYLKVLEYAEKHDANGERYFNTCQHLAVNSIFLNDFKKSEFFLEKYLSYLISKIELNLTYMSSKDKERFLNEAENYFSLYHLLASILQNSDIINKALNFDLIVNRLTNSNSTDITISGIREKIKRREGVVYIQKFNYWELEEYHRYIVYFIQNNHHPVKVVSIDAAKGIDFKILRDFNKSKDFDTTAYEYFWEPLSEMIGKKKVLFIKSSGTYTNLDVKSLRNPATNVCLGETYRFINLLSLSALHAYDN
jgi:tetratricopeptide (TPR) repeat protein